jgi:hypothetical protein
LEVSFAITKIELLRIFEDLKYERNVDYANLDEKQEDGKPRTYV